MHETAHRLGARRFARSISFQLLLFAAVVFLYNRLIYATHSISSAADFSTWAVPLYAMQQTIPAISALVLQRWIAAIVVGAVWIVLSLRGLRDQHSGLSENAENARGFAMGAVVGVVVLLNITIAMMDDGARSIEWPFTFSGKEYFGEVRKIADPVRFLRDYPTLSLGHHPRTHPPGGVMFLWAVAKLIGPTRMTAALSAIVTTALAIVPATLLARRMLTPRGAGIFVALYVLTPNLVIFGATSMDGVFMFFLLVCAWVFFSETWSLKRPRRAVLHGLHLGFWLFVCSFFTYATLGMVLLFVIWGIFQLLEDRQRGWRTLGMLAIAAATLVACFGLLYALTGCNIIACLKASIAFDAEKMRPQREQYWDTSLTNLLGFLVGSGFIASVLWMRAGACRLKPARRGDAGKLSASLLITVLVLSFSTLFTRELERVWMFFTPLLLIGAASELDAIDSARHRARWIAATMILLFAQTWLTQFLLYTLW